MARGRRWTLLALALLATVALPVGSAGAEELLRLRGDTDIAIGTGRSVLEADLETTLPTGGVQGLAIVTGGHCGKALGLSTNPCVSDIGLAAEVPYTISAYIRPTGMQDWAMSFDHYWQRYGVKVSGNNVSLHVFDRNNSELAIVPLGTATPGQWTRIAWTYDSVFVTPHTPQTGNPVAYGSGAINLQHISLGKAHFSHRMHYQLPPSDIDEFVICSGNDPECGIGCPWLQLGEIQPEGTNIARHGSPTQSSIPGPTDPRSAIDGVTLSAEGFEATTDYEPSPSWTVNFGDEAVLESLVLYLGNSGTGYWNNLKVMVAAENDSDFQSPVWTGNTPWVRATTEPVYHGFFPEGTTGQYVRIQAEDSGETKLSLIEVEIYGQGPSQTAHEFTTTWQGDESSMEVTVSGIDSNFDGVLDIETDDVTFSGHLLYPSIQYEFDYSEKEQIQVGPGASLSVDGTMHQHSGGYVEFPNDWGLRAAKFDLSTKHLTMQWKIKHSVFGSTGCKEGKKLSIFPGCNNCRWQVAWWHENGGTDNWVDYPHLVWDSVTVTP